MKQVMSSANCNSKLWSTKHIHTHCKCKKHNLSSNYNAHDNVKTSHFTLV